MPKGEFSYSYSYWELDPLSDIYILYVYNVHTASEKDDKSTSSQCKLTASKTVNYTSMDHQCTAAVYYRIKYYKKLQYTVYTAYIHQCMYV